MSMHPQSPAPVDDELQDLDLSQSGRNKLEIFDVDHPSIPAPSAVVVGSQRISDKPSPAVKELGKDNLWGD